MIRSERALAALLEAYSNRFWSGESCFPENQIEILGLLDMLLAAVPKQFDDVALASAHALHIDHDAPRAHAVIRAAMGQVSDSPTRNHRFGGRAAFIDARSTNVLPLDQCGPPPGIRQRLG